MFEKENIDTQTLLVIGIVAVTVTFLTIVGLQVLWYRIEKAEAHSKFVDVRPAMKAQVQAQEREQLSNYRWTDRANGQVAIPIERAMELELQALQSTGK